MKTPNVIINAPQLMNPARQTEDSFVQKIAEKILVDKPTLLGHAPPGLESRFTTVPAGQLPEFTKLPPPRGRCPITGASRSWLLDMEKLGRVRIVRIRQPGRMRGACFLQVESLMALLRAGLEGGENASRN